MTSTPELLRQIVAAVDEKLNVVNYRWNPNTLAYEVETVGGGTGADVNVTNTPLPVTSTQLPAALSGSGNLKVAVVESTGGGLTDTELRAAPVPVSGPLTDTQLRAAAVPVSGPLTDAQLRAAAVPVSAAVLPLPAGASTEATLALIKAKTDNIDVLLSTRTKPADVQKVDGSAVTQPVSGPLTDTQLRASAVQVDVADEDTRLLGRTKVLDSASTVIDPATKGQLPGALAASGALKVDQQSALPAGTNTIGKVDQGAPAANANAWPVSDAAGSLTVDAPVGTPVFVRISDGAAALAGQKVMASSLPVVIASDQSNLPTNLAQIGGSAIALKALPTGGAGQAVLPVYANAIQLLTYTFGARAIVTGALTANTAKAILSLEVAAANAKTVKIRRILISGIQTTTLAGLLDIQVNRGSAASSAGTAVTAGVRVAGDTAPSTVVKTLPTIVAATVLDQLPFGAAASAAVSAQGATVLYDWQEGGETKPWTLKPTVIDSLVLMAISTAAQNWTLTVHITLTEE